MGEASIHCFSDGEIQVEIKENVRGCDVYVLQSTCPPVNFHLMELLVMIDALKRASTRRISAVIPYYGYGRQDQKDKPRASITAKTVADLLTAAGVDQLISFDLHASQIEGFFIGPVDNVLSAKLLHQELKQTLQGDDVIIAPDAGGVERARKFAEGLNIDLAIMDHRGVDFDPAVVGNVSGRPVIILDDMVDTGQTLVRAARAAHAAGARVIDACCTHAVFSADAVETIDNSPLRNLTVTDTVPLSPQASRSKKIRTVSIAPMLAEVIERIILEQSVSSLFVQ
jgi:ribose-phosphate pyrophosphokinase